MKFQLSKYHLLGLSILSGILMGLAWPVAGWGPLTLIGLSPLLFIEHYIYQNKTQFARGAVALFSLPGFLVWNVWTTWWVWNSSEMAIAAFVLNSLFMAFTFGLGHIVRRNLFRSDFGYIAIIGLWLSFEYLHQEWDLTWTWLTLGNGFASSHKLIQWYEYTGVFGGTLWIWLANIFFFKVVLALIQKLSVKRLVISRIIPLLLIVFVPVCISLVQYHNYEEQGELVEVVAVQQNLDPYGAQYTTSQRETIHRVLNLVRKEVSSETDVVICPESTLQGRLWEDDLNDHLFTDSILNFLEDYPDLSFIVGASTSRMLEKDEELMPEARPYWRDSTQFYYNYNTAIHYRFRYPLELYHKSKMVPGVERMPFKKVLKFVDKLALDLGGTTGSLGFDQDRAVFKATASDFAYAPVICYESIYSRFVSDYMTNGANLICIITNDGWWENTPGHRQHFEYAKLRAIENRTSVARSANTGISGFINQRGDVLSKTEYWVEDVVKGQVYANPEKSFYAERKDFISNLAMFFSALLLLALVSLKLRKKKD
jgi:apolipoprotein N-acyltransferase